MNEIARFNSKVLPLYPQRINSEARKINGFNLIAWEKENALSGEEATKKLITFLSKLERKPYFIAFNSWFDSAFLSNLFRKHDYRFDHWFDYKVFDIRISGIWMAQEQRSTFTSFLSKNNGEIMNLIKKIELQIN